jgi:DNA-binding NarL/FixJ family response regulator
VENAGCRAFIGEKRMADPYRILLADNYAMLRQEIKKIIEDTDDLKVVGEVGEGAALLQFLAQDLADLAIVDISLPHLRAMETTRLIKQSHPEVKVLIMVLDHDEEYLAQAIRVGAEGLLLKQYIAAEILKAIRVVRAGKFYLPPQFRGKKSYSTTSSWSGVPLSHATSR